MTGSQLVAGYALVGVGYIFWSFAVQSIGAMNRPPVDGHLDINIKFRRLEWWYVLSIILVIPFAIVYSGEPSRDYIDQLNRANYVLSLFVVLALVWIVKLQLQLNKLTNRKVE